MTVAQRVVAHCGAGRTLQEAIARDGLGRWPPDRGKDWHVHTEDGSASNSGERADDTLNSITRALAKCEADRRDRVIVHRWLTDNDETWPLPMSVAGVTLMAVPLGARYNQNRAAYIVCPDNTAVIDITAHRCRLEGLLLQCPTSYDAVIFSDGSSGSAWTGIDGCYFAGCKHGIGAAGTADSIGWTSEITNCMFTNSVTESGIWLYNPAHILIQNNVFSRVQGTVALYLHNAGRPRILDNRFGLNADLKGGAITFGDGVHGGTIDGNRANAGQTKMSANPYYEPVGAVDFNDWLLNYWGETATQPATT